LFDVSSTYVLLERFSGDFNEGLLSPLHAFEEEFVAELENYAKSNCAVTHHLLTNLARASFGRKGTADVLLRLLSAYSRFNSGFITNVETLLGLLDDERHVQILTENLEEEMGRYDEGLLRECEALGIPREAVEGVPHRELFRELADFVEAGLRRSYSEFVPAYVHEELVEAVGHARSAGKPALLAPLYFGSELIVPRIYSSILKGLCGSIDNVSNEDAKFLILHIDMDQDHAAALREIVVSCCRTKANRHTSVQCTKKLLDARVAFYDSLVGYSSLVPVARGAPSICGSRPNNWSESKPARAGDSVG